jgi:hypothetical protein
MNLTTALKATSAVALFSLWACGGDVDIDVSSGTGTASSTGSGGAGGAGGAGGESPVEPSPCDAKGCGSACVTEAFKGVCDANGTCVAGAASCPGYEPCFEKSCGSSCSTCDPSAPGCAPFPGATCSAEGQCSLAPEVCPAPCEVCDVLGKGPWLIGWGGGLDHFSWIRFTFVVDSGGDPIAGGDIEVLDSACVSCTPYYACQGAGWFSINSGTNEVVLQLPSGCSMSGMPQTSTLSFSNVGPTMGYPPKSVLFASVQELETASSLEAFQYDHGHCNAAFTMCGDPFQ